MNKKFSLLVAVLLLSSCYEPKTDEEREFVQICTNANKELSAKACGCIYNRHSSLESLQYTKKFYQEKIHANEQAQSQEASVSSVEKNANSGDLEKALAIVFNEEVCN